MEKGSVAASCDKPAVSLAATPIIASVHYITYMFYMFYLYVACASNCSF